MTWCSSRRAVADVLDLGLEELVALAELGELLQGQRVDRAEGGELASRARSIRAVGSTPSASSGRRARPAPPRASQPSSRRRVSTTDSRRMVASTRSSSIFCRRLRAAASSCSLAERWRRSSSSRAPPARDRLELAAGGGPGARPERDVEPGLGLDDHVEQARHGGGVGLQPGPALGRLAALVGVTGQPALHLRQTLGQHPPSLDQAGRPHLPLAAARRRLGDPLVDAPALLARPPPCAPRPRTRASSSPGSSARQLGRPGGVAGDPLVELGLGHDRSPPARRPRGARSSATRWRAARAVWWATSLRSSARTASAAAVRVASTSTRAAARSSAASAAATPATSARARASSTRAAVTTPPPARTRQPVDENRSPSRVTTTRSGRARARSMASDHPPRAQHEPASKVSSTASRPGTSLLPRRGAHVGADRLGPGGSCSGPTSRDAAGRPTR